MPPPETRERSKLDLLLAHPGGAVAVSVLYVALGLWALFHDHLLHDEGLTTYFFARFVGDDAPAAFFFQKFKPVVAAFYAPIAAWGLVPFAVVHLLVGALAMPLVAAAARTLGIRRANVAALVVGLSPLFLVSGPTGLSNGDGVVAVCLFLWLLVRSERGWPAGLVLGALPWVRAELGLFVVAFVLHEALTRRRRDFFAGCAAFPLAYLGAGAVYHRDLLWAVHFPPSAPAMATNPLWQAIHRHASVGELGANLALVTPAIALAFLVRRERLRLEELTGALFAAGALLVMNVLPAFEAFNFNYSSRYLLLVLPPLALLAARAADGLAEADAPSRVEAPGLAVALAGADRVQVATSSPVELGLLAVVAAALVAARAGARQLGLAAWLALLLLAPVLLSARMVQQGYQNPRFLLPMVQWLEAHPEQVEGRTVYTNANELASWLVLTGRAPGVTLRYVESADHTYELDALGNPANGQRAAVAKSMETHFFGPLAHLRDARGTDVVAGSVFLLKDDGRFRLSVSDELAARLRVVSAEPDFDVAIVEASP